MKKIFFVVAVLFAILGVNQNANAQAGTVIGTLKPSGEIELVVNIDIFKPYFERLHDPGTVFNSISVEKIGGDFYYIVGRGHNGQNSRSSSLEVIAIPNSEPESRTLMAGKVTNSCSGDGCSLCEFEYASGVFLGCKCAITSGKGGKCNHTVTDDGN